MKKAVLLAAAVLALLCLGAIGYRHYLVAQLRQPILDRLNDPDSASFRNERYVGPWTVSGGVLCGEVNAKNRMGGYVGYTHYWSIFGDHKLSGIEERPGESDIAAVMCDELEPAVQWWWLRY
jgi:hypothetical protein